LFDIHKLDAVPLKKNQVASFSGSKESLDEMQVDTRKIPHRWLAKRNLRRLSFFSKGEGEVKEMEARWREMERWM
jgi:hypothetical protein